MTLCSAQFIEFKHEKTLLLEKEVILKNYTVKTRSYGAG